MIGDAHTGSVVRTSQPVNHELVQLLDLSADAFCIAGPDGYVRFANPAFARILGYTQEELLARPFLDHVHPDDVDSVDALFAELADGKESSGFECRHICADGSVRWFKWSTHTRSDDGVVYGVARDVTDGHGTSAELDALHRVATLVAGGVRPQDLFAVVAEEVSRVVGVSAVCVVRYELDGTATECANYDRRKGLRPVGARWPIEGTNILRLVRDRAAAAGTDDHGGLAGEMAAIVRRTGIRASVGAPIVVAGRLWGAVLGSTREQEPLPDDAASRLTDFTTLLATAIENAESRESLERLAAEQAALRRMATRVARGVRPDELFATVSDEVGRLVGTDSATVIRYDDDGEGISYVGSASKVSAAFPIGVHWKFQEGMASFDVYRTGRSARSGSTLIGVEGPIGDIHRRMGIISAVASPIVVEGRLWGAMAVHGQEPLPLDTEERLEKFTELVATAIANAEGRAALTRLAEEQAALRRVATLVAQGVRPDEIFAAVSDEVGRLVGTDSATVVKFDDEGTGIIYVGVASKTSEAFPLEAHWKFTDGMASAEVYRTGRSARGGARDWSRIEGPVAEVHHRLRIVSTVASPIVVEGRLWGAVAVQSQEPLPLDTDERLEKFGGLLATAIANAESKSELEASRRRIVAAADQARRRIERDLHDGTQQRLVTLNLQLATIKKAAPTGEVLISELSRVEGELASALDELREMSRGIHPSILSEGGLRPALRALARRSPIPVALDVPTSRRLGEPVEAAAYFVASEALANATKYAQASRIDVSLALRDDGLLLSIRDDGVGGAHFGQGSGLVGLRDRVEALGGTIRIESPPGAGTLLVVALPLEVEQTGSE
ncbi:MAG: histidine kinase [Blastococcus sp.]|nr:histidine kinase [Blastococcus sp.]